MKKIFTFIFIVACWSFATVIFYLFSDSTIQKTDYLAIFLAYTLVGLISGPFLVRYLFKAEGMKHVIYILVGYLIVVPWVPIFLEYLNFLIHPLVLCLFVSFIPVIGGFLGYKIGKN